MPRKIAGCVISGVLASLPFSSPAGWIFAWVAEAPFLLAVAGSGRRQAMALGFVRGIVFWCATMWWLVHVTLIGQAVLLCYLALFSSLFAVLARPFLSRRRLSSLIFLPALWVLVEYLRSHLFTGLPWALAGNSQAAAPLLIQAAAITGVWGISFLVLMANAAAFLAYSRGLPGKKKVTAIACACAAVGACVLYGAPRLLNYALRSNSDSGSVRVVVVQGNIPQELKWDPSLSKANLETYLRLSRGAAAQERPQLIIWPEASYPAVVGESPELFSSLASFAEKEKVPMLVGAVSSEYGRYFNSALLISAQGQVQQEYRKVHLVPFGEFVPLRQFLTFIPVINMIGDISPGRDYTVFSAGPRLRFSALICFEDLFPELSRRFTREGADFLVVVTNDAWYKRSTAGWQHFQSSVMRAVENRTWVCRAANTGISGFIDPSGTVYGEVKGPRGGNIFVEGHGLGFVFPRSPGFSPYTRFGDWFIWVCAVMALLGWVSVRRRKDAGGAGV